MADDNVGFFSSLRSYATEYVQSRRRQLKAKPQTKVEGAGTDTSVTFSGQDVSAADMKDVKKMRESGGIVAQAFHNKALIKFGTQIELQAENDELEEWMHENVGHLNDVILDLGEDAIWYPYALGEIVETRSGNFSHIELIEPWTMMPITDEYGDILYWEQNLDGSYGESTRFEPDDIGSIVLNKSSGRDKTGISEALRSEEEIETFRSNQRAMREATKRIGYPFVHAKAGREGATQLNDTELRRIRNRLADIGPGETQVTGPDVDIDLKSPATVDFGKIQERDMRMLATSLGIPVELLNEGSDGLGSGMPAELRKDLLRLQNEADRRRFADQFVEQFVRPIVRDYAPFDHTMHLKLEFDPFMSKQDEMSSLIQTVGGYLTANEVRERLNMTPIDDEEIGESYSVPEQAEQQEEPQQGMEGEPAPAEGGDTGIFGAAADGGLGIFGRSTRKVSQRNLDIPDDAVRIQDRSEAPEGATIVEGKRGGLAYIKGTGQDEEQDTNDGATPDITIEQSDPDSFVDSVESFMEEEPEKGAFLSPHSAEELEDHTVLQTPDGDTGISISPEGDIQNLYSADDAPSGAGRAMLQRAIEEGGRTLDCYDGFLSGFYPSEGFREVGRMKHNPDLAPEAFDDDKYGQPDVIFMAYNPEAEDVRSDKYYDGDEFGQAKDNARDVAVFD